MRLLRFIPIKLTLILVLGILLGNHFHFGSSVLVFLLLFILALLGFLFYSNNKNPTIAGEGSTAFGIVVILTTLLIGIFTVALTRPQNRPEHYSHRSFQENSLWTVKIKKVLKSTSFSDRYVANIQALDNKKATGKVLLGFSSDSTIRKFQVDDELAIYTELDSINPPLNPHQFDYKKYLRGLGIEHRIRLRSDNFFKSENPSVTLYGIAASIRNQIISELKEADFGEEELSIIQALLLGQRNDISVETYNNYKNAGAVHILAVSGLHIGILLLLLQFLLRPLERFPKGKTLKLILIVVLLWGFALLAGFSASVVRAVTMFSFVAYALYLNRPSNTFNILALSMFFILLTISPLLLFQVGFQMSYAAVFAIVWLYPLLQKFWFPKNKIVRNIWQLLSVSIAAQLGVLPISLFYFHQFPSLFFISNLLVVPALGVILGMGILVIALALLNFLPDVLVKIYNALIGWMNSLIGWVAEQEAFVFQNISFDSVQLVLTYGILICSALFLTKPNFKKVLPLFLFIIGFQFWLFYATFRAQLKESLVLAHQTRNTILLHQKGNLLSVAAQDSARTIRITNDYRIAERIASVSYRNIQNSYKWKGHDLLIIDSLGVYPKGNNYPDYLVLTQSPKLNLERLIDSIHPKTIIADGSNYRSYITRWRKTCESRKLPFHYTGGKGAYSFGLKD